MKKLIVLLLCGLLTAAPLVSLATDMSFLNDLEFDELQIIRDEINDLIAEKKKASGTLGGEEDVKATREEPARVGEVYIYADESYSGDSSVLMEITVAIRGEAANAIAKSFNKYNTRQLEKGYEWMLVMLRLELIESEQDKFDISDYQFKFVGADSVEYQNSYISDNPKEVKPMYVGAEQYAWIGCMVREGDKPYITYNNYGDKTLWFNPNERIAVDTSSYIFELIDSKSEPEKIKEMQYRLAEYGFYTAVPDGKYADATKKAVRNFQKAFGLENTGNADEETLRIIFSGQPIPAPADE